MKETEFYRWFIPEAFTGKLRLTRYRMTVEEAQRRYPGCKPDLTSREVRILPEKLEERRERADEPLYRRGP